MSVFDWDHDGDIDGLDFTIFAGCYNKAGNPMRCDYTTHGIMADVDFDGDVDGEDFAAFLGCYNRSGRPYKCPDSRYYRVAISGRVTDATGRGVEDVRMVAEPK